MAASTAPLVWDFNRALGAVDGLGGTVHYYDEQAQSIYLKGGDSSAGFATVTANVDEGQWETAAWSEEIQVSPDFHADLALDHPHNGVLYGATLSGSSVYFIRYVYAMDIGALIDTGTLQGQNDNGIAQLTLKMRNVSDGAYASDTTLFQPGARLTLDVHLGDSEGYRMCVAHIDEVRFNQRAATVPISARNKTGYYLNDSCFGANNVFSGQSDETVGRILELAGITDYAVQPTTHVWTFQFEPKTKILAGIQDICAFYGGWQLVELPTGKIVVGYPYWINANYQATGYFRFDGSREVFRRDISKNADAAYTSVYVTGKGSDGVELTPEVRQVQNFQFWALPAQKIYCTAAPDGLTQEELGAYADDVAERIRYVGVTETFDGPFRPQLLVGDVAQIYFDGDDAATSLGTVTSLRHTMGARGFSTQFTIDSGGSVTDGSSSAVSRTRALGGYNRKQKILDLVRNISQGF